jgi:DNA-directed RNA polymerase specialized sigma24 family protein
MKLTKAEKNQNPKLYGYGSLEQLLSDPNNSLTHWIPYKDADGDLRFIPCEEDYFHFYRNDVRNERRRRDTESRCLIPSKKFGLVKCRADCSLCPKVRDGLPISIDYMRENYDFDFKDGSYEEHQEQLKEQEQSDFIWNLVSEFNETDQLILKYFNEGKTDAEIAAELNKARSTIQERKTKLIKMLTEKYEKNKK